MQTLKTPAIKSKSFSVSSSTSIKIVCSRTPLAEKKEKVNSQPVKAKTENNAESQQEGSPNSAAHAKLFGLNKASVIRKKSVNNESKLVPSVFNRTVEEVVKFALRTTLLVTADLLCLFT